MIEFFCLVCDHVFRASSGTSHCPECGNDEVIEDDSGQNLDWEGHFEGDMPSSKLDKDMD